MAARVHEEKLKEEKEKQKMRFVQEEIERDKGLNY